MSAGLRGVFAPTRITAPLGAAYLAALVVAWVSLLRLFNLWPDHLQHVSLRSFELGIIDCLARQGMSGGLVCESMGFPSVYRPAFGLPVFVAKAVVAGIGVPLVTADKWVDAVFLGVGLTGSIAFFRHLGFNAWLSLVGAWLFLTSPVIYAQDGYGALRTGFVLVPAYVWLDQRFLAAMSIRAGRWWLRAAGWGLTVAAARVFALFTDGYSFVMSLVLSGLLAAAWAYRATRLMDEAPGRRGPLHRLVAACAGLSVLAGSIGVAYWAYRAYLPTANQFAVMPIDIFRGQGIDLYALFVPSFRFGLFERLQWTQTIVPWQAYSDGASLTDVYLGFTLVGGVVAAFVVYLRRGNHPPVIRPPMLMVLLSGVIALGLSLGPSLKIADFRDPGTLDIANLEAAYSMPPEAATLDLGTAWIYQDVPGINVMRALYRWQLLVRLALITGFLVALRWVLARRYGVAVAGMACLAAFIELAPNTSVVFAAGRSSQQSLEQFERDVVEPLVAKLAPGERVLLQPCRSHTPHNDYLANYICGTTGIRCFNAGGDKAIEAIIPAWPQLVVEIMGNQHERVMGNIGALFEQDALDAVVFTRFGLWESAYGWPPLDEQEAAATEACRKILGPAADSMGDDWTIVLRSAGYHALMGTIAASAEIAPESP